MSEFEVRPGRTLSENYQVEQDNPSEFRRKLVPKKETLHGILAKGGVQGVGYKNWLFVSRLGFAQTEIRKLSK